MKAYEKTLDRVGVTLILLGATKLYLALWESYWTTPEPRGESYLRTFSPLLLDTIERGTLYYVLAGVLLILGGLRTAKYLRYLALVAVAMYGLDLVLPYFVAPWGYYVVVFHLFDPWSLVKFFVPDELNTLVDFIFFFWLQHLLGRPEIAEAQDAPASTRTGLWIGAGSAFVIFAAFCLMLHGGSGEEAIRRVKAQYGNRFNYYVSGINWNWGDPIVTNATVVGFNAKEVQSFDVHWSEANPGDN